MSEANILVVDDEPEVCELIADGLSQDGAWNVDCTTEPLRALEQLSQGRYDVMVTDLVMPQMDGLELARQARALRPRLGVIAITGHASVSSSVAALRLGFADYLQKPFRVEDVRSAVNRLIMRRQEAAGLDAAGDQPAAESDTPEAGLDLQRRLELVSRELTLMEHRLAGPVADLEARCQCADALAGQRDADQVLGMALVLLRTCLPGDEHGIIVLRRKPRRWLGAAKVEGDEVVIRWAERRLARGVIRAVLKRGQPALVEDASRSAVLGDLESFIGRQGSVLVMPLLGADGAAGVGIVRRNEPGMSFAAAEVRRALAQCGEIGRALELAVAFRLQQAEVYAALRSLVEAQEESCGQEGHSRRVARYARDVARRLGLEPARVDALEAAGHLHDIGKLLPPPMLEPASPAPMPQPHRGPPSEPADTADDSGESEPAAHAQRGSQLLQPIGFLKDIVELVRRHHELRLSEAPLEPDVQILGAVELFDELAHDGPHGPGMVPELVLAQLDELAAAGRLSRDVVRSLAAVAMADE